MKKQPQAKKPNDEARRAMTANELRWLGETADGARDKDCTIVWDGDKIKIVERKNIGNRQPLGVDVKTPWHGAGMRGGVSVKIIFGDDPPIQLAANCDAVFFTQSSIEKFVLPYYMRMQKPEWVQKTRDGLYAKGIVAAAHASPSITTGITRKVLTPLQQNATTGEVDILDAI